MASSPLTINPLDLTSNNATIVLPNLLGLFLPLCAKMPTSG